MITGLLETAWILYKIASVIYCIGLLLGLGIITATRISPIKYTGALYFRGEK